MIIIWIALTWCNTWAVKEFTIVNKYLLTWV